MRRNGIRILVAAIFAASFALPVIPAHAAGTLAGAGTAVGPACSGPFAIQGVNTSGSTWSFSVEFAGASTSFCAAGGVPVATGTWNPAVYGCVFGATGTVCVGPVPSGSATTAVVDFCLPLLTCFNGSATILRL